MPLAINVAYKRFMKAVFSGGDLFYSPFRNTQFFLLSSLVNPILFSFFISRKNYYSFYKKVSFIPDFLL
jgi:hypothetical protein